MNIKELKGKTSEQLIDEAEKLGIENASTLRRQEILFAILRGNYWRRCFAIITRWIWFFKSNGIKLSSWTR